VRAMPGDVAEDVRGDQHGEWTVECFSGRSSEVESYKLTMKRS
jgi:hypothetical protein